MAAGEVDHGLIEVAQVVVTQCRVVAERPLTAAVMVRPIVAFAGEVEPLRVAKFIPHKGEITFPAEPDGEQADDFMESDSAINDGALTDLIHVPVHFLIHEPEGERLIAHQRLIVGFSVGDVRFSVAAIGQGAPDFFDIPFFITAVLEELDPVVWKPHGEAMAEADATFRDRSTEPRHTGHIFSYEQHAGAQLFGQLGGELKVEDGIVIDPISEVFIVMIEGGAAVVIVEHGGDAIEAEAIETIFLQPVADIREEKSAHFFLSVVEAF